jgi:cholesterol transport system auxiliary component
MGDAEYLPPMRPLPDSFHLRFGRPVPLGPLLAVALALGAGACSSGPPPTTYDLSAPSGRVRSSVPVQVLIAEPAAVQVLSGQQIVVKEAGGSISSLAKGQWAASLPSLVQARLIHTFENAAQIRAVARPSSGATGDLTLVSEIRSFEIVTPPGEAVVQLSVRMLSGTGRIVAGRIFTARVPVATIDEPMAAHALDQALSTVMLEIVRWVASARPAPPPDAPKENAAT